MVPLFKPACSLNQPQPWRHAASALLLVKPVLRPTLAVLLEQIPPPARLVEPTKASPKTLSSKSYSSI